MLHHTFTSGRRFLLAAVLLLLSPLTAAAETGLGYAKRFPAKWLEQDGLIRLETVCYNYPASSYMYRLCRSEAATTLNARCQRYRTTLERLPDNAHYRKLTDKYCTAARNYPAETQATRIVDNNDQ